MIANKNILSAFPGILKFFGIALFLIAIKDDAVGKDNTENHLKNGIERLTVKQVVEVQRLHVERKFQERVVTGLCKDKYTEKMFPDVCGPQAQWKKTSAAFLQFRNVNQIAEKNESGPQNISTEIQGASLPDNPKISVMYKVTAVYGGFGRFQAEFKMSTGRKFVATVNDSIGGFMLTDINQEGVFMMSTEKKNNPAKFFAVGSRFN